MVDSEIRRYGKLLEAVVKLSDLSTRELELLVDCGLTPLRAITASAFRTN